MPIDPVDLTTALVRCPSVTPEEGGAIRLLQETLETLGFRCTRTDRNGIANLYARYGDSGPVFGFNGHTDVVPPGEGWSDDPFSGVIREGKLYGRGACDMKSGVAAFVAAAAEVIEQGFNGSIAILITGDEEGDGVDGTAAILDWMAANGETLDTCIVGEPTCPEHMGDMMKIGRRGSMTVVFNAVGAQGHAAYPHRASNPLPPLIALLNRLATWRMDEGTRFFDPSTLAITTVDVGNPASNVIPERAAATVNIRFNDAHTSGAISKTIREWAEEAAHGTGVGIDITVKVSGESFINEPGALSEFISEAVESETGLVPKLSTSGGTSDARFITDIAPVIEFGLVGQTMHKTDEHVAVEDILTLTRIYARVMRGWFAG